MSLQPDKSRLPAWTNSGSVYHCYALLLQKCWSEPSSSTQIIKHSGGEASQFQAVWEMSISRFRASPAKQRAVLKELV